VPARKHGAGSAGAARAALSRGLAAIFAPLLRRPRQGGGSPDRPRRIIGYIDERSVHHVSGWARDEDNQAYRVPVEVVLQRAEGEAVLASGVAGEFSPTLAAVGVGDGQHAFHVFFPTPLSEADREGVCVRPVGTQQKLPLAPALRTVFEPIDHVAMDIVNNCNLRCPFCVYDYSQTRRTELMSEATYDAALRLLPFVRDGNFWLSCLHEATMHPDLLRLIDKVPLGSRRKLMFTTNLARRMPEQYFAALAASGMHHLNVSLESFEPGLYERLRQGARHEIFQENWDRLLTAFAAAPTPPQLRYIIMGFRSNLAELPRMVDVLLRERQASAVEIRDIYVEPHIPASFLAAERLAAADWTSLGEQLRRWPPERVAIPAVGSSVPDAEEDGDAALEERAGGKYRPAVAHFGVPRPINMRIKWNGTTFVYAQERGEDGVVSHRQFMVTNIAIVRDPLRFLMAI
jgi:hypothetical protein